MGFCQIKRKSYECLEGKGREEKIIDLFLRLSGFGY
jgi:hypothetical protein